LTQADPLGDVERFIDVQMRPIKVPAKASDQDADKASDQDADKASEQAADKASEQASDKDSEELPPKLVKHYLIKWKSRSYLHCSWYGPLLLSRSPVSLNCFVRFVWFALLFDFSLESLLEYKSCSCELGFMTAEAMILFFL
jgi:hypothetical protein